MLIKALESSQKFDQNYHVLSPPHPSRPPSFFFCFLFFVFVLFCLFVCFCFVFCLFVCLFVGVGGGWVGIVVIVVVRKIFFW